MSENFFHHFGLAWPLLPLLLAWLYSLLTPKYWLLFTLALPAALWGLGALLGVGVDALVLAGMLYLAQALALFMVLAIAGPSINRQRPLFREDA